MRWCALVCPGRRGRREAAPADIWRELPDERARVITSNGRPVAILATINESNFEQSPLRFVLDINVLVSGLLSPFGAPGEIVRLASSGTVALCFDGRLLSKYDDVLARPRFGFDHDSVAALLDYRDFASEKVTAEPLPVRLPDGDDEAFLEVASACGAECLVTGGLAHFPVGARAGVNGLSPAQFTDRNRSRGASRET